MSQSQHRERAGSARTETSSPYATDEDWHYWPKDEQGNPIPQDQQDDQDADGHEETYGTDKWAFVAKGMLKKRAPLYCPHALNDAPYVTPISDDLEPADLCRLSYWLWGGNPDRITRSNRTATHRANAEVGLTEETLFAPVSEVHDNGQVEYGTTSRPFRVNEEHGYLPDGPIFGNRPIEELQKDIWAILEGAVLVADGISYATAEAIWNRAMGMKRDGDAHDQTIMGKVAEWVRHPRRLDN
jgi:hypothetical protein